ncbi:F-box/FBD/LRR-repeat protein At1g13570-like isoform X2 [Salvia hispanica]|uniref:F-box/FBD/LRR-repeat protein At1g13570-like isoform X2 n=1 Tax=Salvia hispanica TaxID=49212 RepID=UPI0020097BEA|nr:F-box/FBD/LRR-repeat protein At1g13570-like isoform X2 [Salvia hispanica]
MENLKRLHRDILRELPDMLIFDIFWRLPMTDVVRTSLLSKGWRNFWTTSPFLNFDNRAMLFGDDSKLQNFVNRALSCWNGNRVLKFRFHSRHKLASSMFSDVDLWVNFAVRNGVEEFHLHVWCNSVTGWRGFDGKEVYRVPLCLYSCSSLKELSLQSCNLEIDGNVQWNKLESLTIKAFRVTANLINQILSATPHLKVFDLTYVDKGGNLSIQSTSLKELSIFKYFLAAADLFVVSELRICTPNLETLEISGFPYKKYLLMDVSSLTRAFLDSVPSDHFFQFGLSNALSQILPSIQHVEYVALSDCCTKEIGAMKTKCALEMFPQLNRLVIEDEKGNSHQDDTESLKFEANLPESFLLRLRTVEVTWSEGYGVFPLIEILLKYASKLEKIVFQLNEIKSPATSDSLFYVSEKLLRMRRSSSSNCKIVLTKLRPSSHWNNSGN